MIVGRMKFSEVCREQRHVWMLVVTSCHAIVIDIDNRRRFVTGRRVSVNV